MTSQKVSAIPRRRFSVNQMVDYAFFVFAGLAAIWLAWLVLGEGFSWGWWQILFYVLFWLVLAYLVLPRLHRILTQLYVPNYFIGRTRTSDGLLGDPINLALLGDEAQLDAAMRAAGWTRADEITLRSSWRIVTSTVLRRSYDEAPVSPLLLFERQQDAAYQQEVLGNPAKRHHVRFWRCPDGWLLPGGHRVDWLAAGTFDRSVGFSLFTLQITHKIDADTDIERDHIVSTLTAADDAIEVRVIKDFSTGYHSRNGGGDSIVTDGDLPVVDLRSVRVRVDATGSAGSVASDGSGTSVGALDPAALVASAASAVSPEQAVTEAARRAPALIDPRTPKRRPVPTSLGAGLMLLRVVISIISIGEIVLNWHRYVVSAEVDVKGLSAEEIEMVGSLAVGVLVAFLAGTVLLYLLLALFVYRGANAARIVTMVLSATVVIASAIDFFNGGPSVTLRANLFGLPLDILILLALSSDRARLWARLPRRVKRLHAASA
jgi:hypothetical protein